MTGNSSHAHEPPPKGLKGTHLVLHLGAVTTSGERVRQERLRRKLSRERLGELAGISAKSVQRIEAGERDNLLFLVEEALGLPPSNRSDDSTDDAAVLRRVSHQAFWLEAARRALQMAGEEPPVVPDAEAILPDEDLRWARRDLPSARAEDDPDSGEHADHGKP